VVFLVACPWFLSVFSVSPGDVRRDPYGIPVAFLWYSCGIPCGIPYGIPCSISYGISYGIPMVFLRLFDGSPSFFLRLSYGCWWLASGALCIVFLGLPSGFLVARLWFLSMLIFGLGDMDPLMWGNFKNILEQQPGEFNFGLLWHSWAWRQGLGVSTTDSAREAGLRSIMLIQVGWIEPRVWPSSTLRGDCLNSGTGLSSVQFDKGNYIGNLRVGDSFRLACFGLLMDSFKNALGNRRETIRNPSERHKNT